MGPGSPEYLTEKAKERVRKAGIIVGWKLELLSVQDLREEKKVYLEDKYDDYEDSFKEALKDSKSTGRNIAVLRNGDPCISDGLEKLLGIFKDFDVEIIPGISSVQLAAAKAKINLDDSVIVSFHYPENIEKEKNFMVDSIRKGKHLIVLPGFDFLPNKIADCLISKDIKEATQAIVYENLTLENEKSFKGSLKEVASKEDFSWLSTMVIKHISRK